MKKGFLIIILLSYTIISIAQEEKWPDMFVESIVKKHFYAGSSLSQEFALIGPLKDTFIPRLAKISSTVSF